MTLRDPGVGSSGKWAHREGVRGRSNGGAPHRIARDGPNGEDPGVRQGGEVRIVAVLNRFSEPPIEVTATVASAPDHVIVGEFETVTLDPGEAAGRETPVTCDRNGPVRPVLRISATGADLESSFELTTSFDVTIVRAIPKPERKPGGPPYRGGPNRDLETS